MEEKSLEEGGARIKFACTAQDGPYDVDALRGAHSDKLLLLSAIMARLESAGAAPVLPDGLVGGNAALRVGASLLFVSRSGKPAAHRLALRDFVLVTSFDEQRWACTYQGDWKPSSDTPLLWGATLARFNRNPVAVVHGHAIAHERDAEALQCPISAKETLFSTRDDWLALRALLEAHPQGWLYVRKGHGFFLMRDNVDDVDRDCKAVIEPYLRAQRRQRDSKL